MNSPFFYKLQILPVLAAFLVPFGASAADDATSPFTGHIDLVSKYVLRGITTQYGNGAPLGNVGADAPESDRPALQWGIDWVHASGWSLGYFGSMVNYSYKQLGRSYDDPTITDYQHPKSIENDFYGAYSGKLGEFGYTFGLTGYYYINGKNANGLETKVGLSYGPFSAYAQTLLNDVVWGNSGDTYYSIVYTAALPKDITFTGTLGAYSYDKTGNFIGSSCGSGSYLNVTCSTGAAPVGSAFRHLTLALSAPIPETPFVVGIQAIFGGKSRFGINQKNQIVGSLTYAF